MPESTLPNLSALPGSLWGLLAKMSWGDPAICRAHVMPFEAALEGDDSNHDGTGTPIDAEPVEVPDDVVAKSYFAVRYITGHVERDPTNLNEQDVSTYIQVQIEDQEHQYAVARRSFQFGDIAGRAGVPGVPMDFTEIPLVFLPAAKILVTFQARAGFPSNNPCSCTQLTTRRVELRMHGMLIHEGIVDQLINANREELQAAGLLNKRKRA